MNENATSNIKQILTSFENLWAVLENPNWAKSANAEEIKSAFKLGSFIEKMLDNFKSKNALTEFLLLLEQWCKTKNRTKVYNAEFLGLASDYILEVFFKSESISETTLDLAVRVYTSIYPKERFKNAISKLILTSSSIEAVVDFAKSCTKTENLEYYIILKNWSDSLELGKQDVIKNEISNYLSLYKIQNHLYLLIGILSLETVLESEKLIQKLILECILEKMLDRSILSKNLWITLFQKIDTGIICKVCCNFEDFLVSLFNFIEYIGSMMKKEQTWCISEWKGDINISFCPEINYFNLLRLIRHVSESNSDIKKYVISRLTDAKEHTDSSIWDQLKNEIM